MRIEDARGSMNAGFDMDRRRFVVRAWECGRERASLVATVVGKAAADKLADRWMARSDIDRAERREITG